jgi:hypothetical protein
VGKERTAPRPAGGRRRRDGWVAPDDNPEFLKSLKDEEPKDEKPDEKLDEKRDEDGEK